MTGFEKELQQIKDLIDNNTKFLLINHIRMDPDAFGSLSGFYFILKKLGKEVRAINDEQTPENFGFLLKEIIFEPNLNIAEYNPEVIISFDAASLEQLGKTYENNKKVFENIPFIVIDHHITNPGFGKINIINTVSSSSCELVYDIINEFGYTSLIDEEIATLLLAGIHTDTNTFYNKNTTSHTFEVAGKLIDTGGRNKEIIFEFFRKKTLEKVHLWGKIMPQIQQRDGITWVSVTKELYEGTTEGDQGFKGFINEFLANIEGTKVAIFLYEQNDGSIKASLRSNDDTVNVAEVCLSFGGGGHKLAAGFTSNTDIKTLEDEILTALKKVL